MQGRGNDWNDIASESRIGRSEAFMECCDVTPLLFLSCFLPLSTCGKERNKGEKQKKETKAVLHHRTPKGYGRFRENAVFVVAFPPATR